MRRNPPARRPSVARRWGALAACACDSSLTPPPPLPCPCHATVRSKPAAAKGGAKGAKGGKGKTDA